MRGLIKVFLPSEAEAFTDSVVGRYFVALLI